MAVSEQGNSNSTLRDALESKTRDELNTLARQLGIAGFSRLQKSVLIDEINKCDNRKLKSLLIPTLWERHHNHVYGVASVIGVLLSVVFFLWPSTDAPSLNSALQKQQKESPSSDLISRSNPNVSHLAAAINKELIPKCGESHETTIGNGTTLILQSPADKICEGITQLRMNLIYLTDLRAVLGNKSSSLPHSQIQCNKIGNALEYYEPSSVEDPEKHYFTELINLICETGKKLTVIKNPVELRTFNGTAELTIDDMIFANGFLDWFWSHIAKYSYSLSPEEAYELGPFHQKPFDDTDKPNLRYFTDAGSPVVSYSDYLGLID